MKLDLVDKIVNAVLYEGYILYPYRASSTKNRRRFTFGRVYPHTFNRAQQGAEPYTMKTQFLVEAQPGFDPPTITATVRFLHPLIRQVGRLPQPLAEWPDNYRPVYQPVPELRVSQSIYQTWEEAVERQVNVLPPALNELIQGTRAYPFVYHGSEKLEPLPDEQDHVVGVLLRRQEGVGGKVEVSAEALTPTLFKVTVQVFNLTALDMAGAPGSEDPAVLMRTFASTHTVLTVQNGKFVSLMDPPPVHAGWVAQCHNEGTWPVLVGDESRDDRNILLSSPIILYDYPEIAPESPGDLFDSTEIDEILTLRIMTMTDEEKWEMRHLDERAREILQRTERMDGDDLLRMHGTLREIRPAIEETK